MSEYSHRINNSKIIFFATFFITAVTIYTLFGIHLRFYFSAIFAIIIFYKSYKFITLFAYLIHPAAITAFVLNNRNQIILFDLSGKKYILTEIKFHIFNYCFIYADCLSNRGKKTFIISRDSVDRLSYRKLKLSLLAQNFN